MNIKGKKITFGLTSSFYTFANTIVEIKKIILGGGEVIPVMSEGAYTTDTKYGKAKDFISKIEEITNRRVIYKMSEADEINSDIMVIAPCSRQ